MIMRTLVNSWRLRHELQRLNRRDKVDIVQIASLHAIGFFKSHRIPSIVRISSDNSLWRHADQYVFDMERAMQDKTMFDRMELYAVRHMDYAFAPSKCCSRIVAKRARCKVSVIESPYLVQTQNYDDSVYQSKLVGKKYLLFNSTLSVFKGTPVSIAAVDELMSLYPDLYMVYAGMDGGIILSDGVRTPAKNILNHFNKKYNGRVIYLGCLKREQLFPVIANAYACVLLSRIENLSNSCIEAMSLKKIVIATYGTSFEQLIRNKENGLLIKKDSHKALLKAVKYLESMSDEERARMEASAQKSVERLGEECVYNNMMKVYSDLIKKFRRKIV